MFVKIWLINLVFDPSFCLQTVVLKVNVNCHGCRLKVKKILKKIEGFPMHYCSILVHSFYHCYVDFLLWWNASGVTSFLIAHFNWHLLPESMGVAQVIRDTTRNVEVKRTSLTSLSSGRVILSFLREVVMLVYIREKTYRSPLEIQ